MKKKLLKIFMIIAILFVAYNVVWFTWSHIKYGKLAKGMHEGDFSSFITPRYVYSKDGYDYLVKYPDYLSLSGNLSVGLPSEEDDNPFTDALIIWPKASGRYEFGALLYEKAERENQMTGYNIYIDAEGNALFKEDQEIVKRHSEAIKDLLAKADERWDIIN